MKYCLLAMGVLCSVLRMDAQTLLSEKEAVRLALERLPGLRAGEIYRLQQEKLSRARAVWEPGQVYSNNGADPDWGAFGTTVLGYTQTLPNPMTQRARREYHAAVARQAEAENRLAQAEASREVRRLYRHLSYLQARSVLLEQLDSAYLELARIAQRRYETGETSLLEYRQSADKAARIRLELAAIGHEIAFDRAVLGQWTGLPSAQPMVEPMLSRSFSMADTARIAQTPLAEAAQRGITTTQKELLAEKAQRAPATSIGINAQYTANGAWFPGYQLGLSLPLAQKGWKQRMEALALSEDVAAARYAQTLLEQRINLGHLLHELEKYQIGLDYYAQQGESTAFELRRSATSAYTAGDIGYIELVHHLDAAMRIDLEQLDNLYGYHLTLVELQFVLGE